MKSTEIGCQNVTLLLIFFGSNREPDPYSLPFEGGSEIFPGRSRVIFLVSVLVVFLVAVEEHMRREHMLSLFAKYVCVCSRYLQCSCLLFNVITKRTRAKKAALILHQMKPLRYFTSIPHETHFHTFTN